MGVDRAGKRARETQPSREQPRTFRGLLSPDGTHSAAWPSLDSLTPSAARGIVMRFGDLGRWVLEPAVFRLARQDSDGLGPTSVPCLDWGALKLVPAIGACWVLAVNRDRDRDGLLRPCFVLPLRWREDGDHSPHLSRDLVDLANRVIDSLSREPRIKGCRWSLHPGPWSGLDRYDLSKMTMDARSAWAPLAAGLLLAADGIAPDAGVWATGGWDPERGISEVGGLEAKLRMAAECHARTVFVPAAQLGAATDWKVRQGEPFEILPFPGAGEKAEPRKALREYLARLGARPDPSEAFEVRSRYYRLQTDPESRRRFYIENLLPELADYYRGQLPPDCRPSHLVTIASDSPELAVLLARTIRADRCLILFTREKEGPLKLARDVIGQGLPDCDLEAARFENGAGMFAEMREHVERFMKGVHPGRVLFDLTPGTKEMSILLSLRIAPPGSYLFYARHEIAPGPIVIPEKRRPLLVRALRGEAAGAD